MSLTPVDTALRQLLSGVVPLATETVPLAEALGRYLAEAIASAVDVPPADNSAMDGYALAHRDLEESLPLLGRVAAGDAVTSLPPGGCVRIFTGAELPRGADTVVMQEDCEVIGDRVHFRTEPKPGQHVRPKGQDMRNSETVLKPGAKLTAACLGVAASAGRVAVKVWQKPKVAILSTGAELVEPGQVLAPGQIYNSNRPMLFALVQSLGCDVIDAGIVADTPQATREALRDAAASADVVISTGGVSVGEEDHVKPAVEALGSLSLWKLAIKPGKPLAFGDIGGVPFFGLPGNPASSFVTALVLLRPYLIALQGGEPSAVERWPVSSDFDWEKPGKRREYLRVRVARSGDGMVASRYPNQSSGVLRSAAWANALAVIEPGQVFKAGELIEVILLDQLLA